MFSRAFPTPTTRLGRFSLKEFQGRDEAHKEVVGPFRELPGPDRQLPEPPTSYHGLTEMKMTVMVWPKIGNNGVV